MHITKRLAPDFFSVCTNDVQSLLEFQVEASEQRWVAVGTTRDGRILNIVFAVRGDAMRSITGWVADKETAEMYLREWGQD